MVKRSLRVLLALALIVVWWCFTPSLFRVEFEFGIEIPDGVTSKCTLDRVYGPSRTMTALGFYDRWEDGSTTTLMIPASCLVEFLHQFTRMECCGGPPGCTWRTDELMWDPGLQDQHLCFRITTLDDGRFGDYISLDIQRVADDEFECHIRSSWD